MVVDWIPQAVQTTRTEVILSVDGRHHHSSVGPATGTDTGKKTKTQKTTREPACACLQTLLEMN